MSRYKAYAEYKDSGFEWMGSIPKHWVLTKISWNFVARKGRNAQMLNKEYCGSNLGIYPVYSGQTENDGVMGLIDTFEFDEGVDGVLFATTVGAKAMHLSHLKGKFSLSQNCMIISPKNTESIIRFCFYHFQPLFSYERALIPEHMQASFRMEDLYQYQIAKPPIVEQEKIANFLDHETAKIDTLIAKQQGLIKLLKEKRQAVISHAVTKGLNPNAPMRDSGVEWLGEVPAHWVCKSYRHACNIYRGKFGHRPRNDPAFYDGAYPFIQTGDVAQARKYITEYKQTLNEKGKSVSQLFPVGTLVMTIAANIGDTAILSFEAYAPDSIVGFKPREDIDLEFLRYSLMGALPALVQTSTQSTQANLNIERVGAVQAAFPTKEEQLKIVRFIDETLERYDRIEEKANIGVELLMERRTALISAAVTGKIDVRDWQPAIDSTKELAL
jgi:type I restriction enzyme S subunit